MPTQAETVQYQSQLQDITILSWSDLLAFWRRDVDHRIGMARLWPANVVVALETERDALKATLRKINGIRNSIIGQQGFNFSEHAYPLVAALNEAGFDTAVPVLEPTGIVIVCPLLSVITSGVPLTCAPTVAVYVIVEPSATTAGAVLLKLTVLVVLASATLDRKSVV